MGEDFKYSIVDLGALHSALEDFAKRLKNIGVSEEGIFDSKLVASELAGNVIRHAKAAADIRCNISGDKIQLEISGLHPLDKACLPDDIFSEHGRGLYLVQTVCEECSMTGNGVKVVVRYTRIEKNQ